MTSPGPVPPLAPDELVSTGGERQVLETFLDLYRDISGAQAGRALSDEEIRQRHVPSQTTLGGLVKHLTAVELELFQVVLGGRPRDASDASPDDSWALTSDDMAASLLAGYERALRGVAPDRIGELLARRLRPPHPRLGQVSLRWIYVHMIEESATHVGHADILREETDGATGFDG